MNTKKFKKGQTVWSLLNTVFTLDDDLQILKGVVKSRKVITDPYNSKTREVYGIEDAEGKGHKRNADQVFGSLQELKEHVEKDILGVMREINKARTSYKKELDYTTKHFRQWKGLLDAWYETCYKEENHEPT